MCAPSLDGGRERERHERWSVFQTDNAAFVLWFGVGGFHLLGTREVSLSLHASASLYLNFFFCVVPPPHLLVGITSYETQRACDERWEKDLMNPLLIIIIMHLVHLSDLVKKDG